MHHFCAPLHSHSSRWHPPSLSSLFNHQWRPQTTYRLRNLRSLDPLLLIHTFHPFGKQNSHAEVIYSVRYSSSLLLDMQIYSSSIKAVKLPRLQAPHSYPMFEDRDKIEGKVILDPSCSKTGRLTVSVFFRIFSSLLTVNKRLVGRSF